MTRFILFIIINFIGRYSFSQDSIAVLNCLNKSNFDNLNCEFPNDSIVNKKIIYSPDYLKIDSTEFTRPDQIEAIIKHSQLDFFKTIKKDQIHCSSENGRTNYYKCYDVDSILFFKVAIISIPLESINTDPIYQLIKRELSQGKEWNKLKYHATNCYPPDKLTKIRGSLGWVPFGNYHKDFEDAIITLEVGNTTLIKLEEYGMACIILKTNEIQKFETKKIRLLSIPNQ
jgi:hypothetical protein